MKTLEELNQYIERWAHERKLDKEATKEAQSVKTAEEFAELIIGISKNKDDLIKDSIGDVYVTLIVGNLVQNKVDLVEIYKKAEKDFKDIRYSFQKGDKRNMIKAIASCMREIATIGYTENSIGMTVMNLMGIANLYSLTLNECVEAAYKEIANRKGRIINGQFVKQEDLPC
ncbi:MazG-like family protein [Peptoniphilus rhinitidis]|uniref:MazG-like family protein n=1 Tax=Peptoniphilus rhinitidis TaxID=1175452 RepID=UPI0002880FF5|nr:MazG-like family protein [Peptoniphilus rhinitidis]